MIEHPIYILRHLYADQHFEVRNSGLYRQQVFRSCGPGLYFLKAWHQVNQDYRMWLTLHHLNTRLVAVQAQPDSFQT